MKTKLLFSNSIFCFIAIAIFAFANFLFTYKAHASGESWYKSSWPYRKAITINGSTAGVQTNYQIKINITYNANMQANFNDIRFTDSNGTTLLNYWMETYVSSSSAVFWVKIPSIPISPSTATVYMYYGNASAASGSSGDNTFSFFDDFNPQSWKTLAVMPSPRADHAAVSLNNKIYLIGGYDNGSSDPKAEVWEYDPAGDSYTAKASLNSARWGAMAVPFGGKIYVFGGQGVGASLDLAAEMYDSSLNTWTNKAHLPAALRNQGIFGAADASYIYLFYNGSLYRYNTSNDTYTLFNSTPPNSLTSWGTMAIYNNKIYIIGGYSGGAVGNVMIYNLGTSSWEANGASMPISLYGMIRESSIVGDNIYIVQGQRNGGEFFSRFWKYNITSNSWSWGALGYWDADGVAGGVIGNKIYTFGGRRVSTSPVGTNFAGVLDTSASDASAKWIDVKTANWRINNGALVAGSNLNTVPQLSTANTVIGGGNSRVISRMKYASGDTGFGGLMLQSNGGLYYNTDNSYLSPYIDITANKDWLLRETGASFPSSASTTPVSSADAWHSYMTTFDSSTVTQTRDGGSSLSFADSTYRSGYLQIFKTTSSGAGTINLQVDYVAVANYASPEPSLASTGSEEYLDHLVITGSPAQTAGSSQTITITAKTNLGNTSYYSGDKSLTFSGANLSPASNNPTCSDKNNSDVNFGTATTVTFTSGIATCTMKLYKAESATVTTTDGTYNANSNSLAVTVNPAAKNKLNWVPQPSTPVTAGLTWNSFSIQITDQYGNQTSDTDNVTITPSSGSFSGTTTKPAISGLATFNNISYTTATTITLTGSATGLTSTPASNSVIVNPSSLNNFLVTIPSIATVGVSFSSTITGRDQYNNTVSSITGITSLSVNQGGSISPSSILANQFTNGVWSGNLTISNISESPTVTLTVSNGASTGTANISVTGAVTAPSAVVLDTITASSMRLTWTDNSTSETGFKIEKSTDGTNYAQIGTASSNTTEYTGSGITSLSSNTRYWYRVKAYNSAGDSSYSTASPKYTLANTPSGLSLNADSSTQITASWNANSNPQGVQYYIENITANANNSGWITNLSWASSNLLCATSYSFHVKARNGDNTETTFTEPVSLSTSTCGGGVNPAFFAPPVLPAGGFNVSVDSSSLIPDHTDNPAITLSFNAGSDVKRIAVSEDPDFKGASQESYTPTKTFTLSEGFGTKTIYIKFYTQYGVSSPTITKIISFKTDSPKQKNLVRASGDYKIYLIENNQKRWIKTTEEFTSLGYKWNQISIIAPERLSVYPDYQSTAVNIPNAFSSFRFSRNLNPGDKGEDVRNLQKFLNQNNFIVSQKGPGSPNNETDLFGRATRNALIRFQNARNITPTGYFGERTRKIVVNGK